MTEAQLPFKLLASKLLTQSLSDLQSSTPALVQLLVETHPPLPIPRSPVRYITRTLGIAFNTRYVLAKRRGLSSLDELSVCTFKERHRNMFTNKEFWIPLPNDDQTWNTKLLQQCNTPRKLCRALARIDAFSRWFQARVAGLQLAAEHFNEVQAPWREKLNARIGGLELAGNAIDQGQVGNVPLSAWPHLWKMDFLAGHKSVVRARIMNQWGWPFSLAESYMTEALQVLSRYGEAAWATKFPVLNPAYVERQLDEEIPF